MHKRNRHIDREIRCVVDAVNEYTEYETLSSCCGHNRYPMTVVVKDRNGRVFDLISGKDVPRKRNFYRRDGEGFYYIPEVSVEK